MTDDYDALIARLEKRLQRDRHGKFDAELSTIVGPGLYEDIWDAIKALRGSGDQLVPIYCKPWRTIVFVKADHKANFIAKNSTPEARDAYAAAEPPVDSALLGRSRER